MLLTTCIEVYNFDLETLNLHSVSPRFIEFTHVKFDFLRFFLAYLSDKPKMFFLIELSKAFF